MNKIIIINRCRECLFCREYDDGEYCTNRKIVKVKKSVDADTIPDWCPLENEQKPKVIKEFVIKWINKIHPGYFGRDKATDNFIEALKETGVEVNDKANDPDEEWKSVRDAYGGKREGDE